MAKKTTMVSVTKVEKNKVKILNDEIELAKEKDKKPKTESIAEKRKLYTYKPRSKERKTEVGTEIEVPETDRLMTIFTKSGNVQLTGPVADLIEFKERIKNKDNRHTFLEAPAKLFTFNPALEAVTVLPADVGVIIIADPMKAPQHSQILAPVGVLPKKLN